MPTIRCVLVTSVALSASGCLAGDDPDTGLVATELASGPPGTYQTALVSARSTWSYFDDGPAPEGWQTGGCCFATAGAGPYGYGESYIATTIAPSRPITTYFRRTFEVDRPIRALFLRVMHDDGFYFYLNGQKGGRASMPSGEITHETLATGHEALERYAIFDISAQIPNLTGGTNTIAIEVHQGSTTSSDLVFDAELLAWVDGPVDVTVEGDIPRGSMWHVWDRAEDPGAWTAVEYDDSGWSAGPGPLGFGEPYLATVVHGGPITTYFRKQVVLDAGVTALVAHVMYDDGFIAYLNGTEIARRSMPAGEVTPTTIARGHEAENRYEAIDLAHAIPLLHDGVNVIAVEVHQGGTMSSDLVFDLELDATRGWTAETLSAGSRFSDVYFRDAAHGWITGREGELFRTTDGGATWTPQPSGTTAGLSRIVFADELHGWISVASGDFLRTVDGGETWTLVDTPLRSNSGVAPIDAATAWTVGHEVDFDYQIYRTTDGGLTWQVERALPGSGRIAYADATRGWLLYWPHFDGRLFVARTDDGGETWTDVWSGGTFGNRYGTGLDVVDRDTVWLVGSESSGTLAGEWILGTPDGGATWIEPPATDNDVYLHDVGFADPQHGWATGAGGSIIHTDDGGISWRVQLEADCTDTEPVTCSENDPMAIHAVDASNVWAVTFDGRVLHTTTGGE